jgi:hypothetical protein
MRTFHFFFPRGYRHSCAEALVGDLAILIPLAFGPSRESPPRKLSNGHHHDIP